MGTPLGTENHAAHQTLVVTHCSGPIIPQALDEDPILLTTTCQVSTVHSPLILHLTQSHWMTLVIQSNLALNPPMSL